jgi:lysozyme
MAARPASEIEATGPHGIALIKGFEGLHKLAGPDKVVPYVCPAGVLTIGWGHTGPDVTKTLVYTVHECEALLKDDLRTYEKSVRDLVSAPITQNQFDALVAFTFNVGKNAFKNSTLRRLVNAGASEGDFTQAFLMFRKIRQGGQLVESAGLVRRRTAEATLFNAPDEAEVIVAVDGAVTVKPAPAQPAPAPAPAPSAAPPAGQTQTPPSPAPEPELMPQKPQPTQKPVAKSRTIWGAVLAAMAGAGAFAKAMWDGAETLWTGLRAQLGFDPIWILAVVFAFAIMLVIYARLDDQRKRVG